MESEGEAGGLRVVVGDSTGEAPMGEKELLGGVKGEGVGEGSGEREGGEVAADGFLWPPRGRSFAVMGFDFCGVVGGEGEADG